MERKTYQTAGRQKLIGFLAKHPDCQFTVEEVCFELNGDCERGRSSVYRQLSELCQADAVRKFRSDERQCSVYQYVGTECDCKNHFHVKCLRCGRMEHLDCGDSAGFARHLLTEHGFDIDCGQSLLYGVCAGCRKLERGDRV